MISSLKLTASLPPKKDGWKTFSFPFGAKGLFSGAFAVSFREGNPRGAWEDGPAARFVVDGYPRSAEQLRPEELPFFRAAFFFF